MSFESVARSLFGEEPVYLFVFSRPGMVLRFCNADRDIVVGGNTYMAAQIDRSEIRQSSEGAKERLSIKFAYLRKIGSAVEYPSTQALGDWWHPWVPTDIVSVTCLQLQRGSEDPPMVQWMGRVMQPVFGDTEMELSCEPGSAMAKAADQGPRVQRACFKEVYSTGIAGCNLDRAGFETVTTLDSVSGVELTAAAFDGQPLTLLGGTCEWRDVYGIRHGRMITYHSGTLVRIHFSGPGLGPGTEVTVFPNCEQTWDACAARRPDPQNHIGSAQYLPVENPTAGGVSMSWR